MEGIAFTKERELFARLEQVASYASLDKEQRRRYDADLKAYRDLKGQLDYALTSGWQQGLEKGIAEGLEKGMEVEREKFILSMAAQGLEIETIAKVAQLSVEEIKAILRM